MAPRKSVSAAQVQKWRLQYESEFALYQTMVLRLRDLLSELLQQHGVDVAQIDFRAKLPESFAEKIRRKRKYASPIDEITDLAGLRVLTYSLEDVDRVAAILRAEFAVDEVNSMVKPETADPDRFGYRSTHVVATLAPPRSQLGEWAVFDGKCFEVQVRTVLQHAWSAIDHKLNYKTLSEVPQDLQRRLFRVSALLEVADEQLNLVEQERRSLSAEYTAQIERGELASLSIDAASVDVYLRVSGAEAWVARLSPIGFVPIEDPERIARDRSDLLDVLADRGVRTIGQLDSIVSDAESWGESLIEHVVAAYRAAGSAGDDLESTADDALAMFVLYATLAPPQSVAEIGWWDPIAIEMNRLITATTATGRRPRGSPARPKQLPDAPS